MSDKKTNEALVVSQESQLASFQTALKSYDGAQLNIREATKKLKKKETEFKEFKQKNNVDESFEEMHEASEIEVEIDNGNFEYPNAHKDFFNMPGADNFVKYAVEHEEKIAKVLDEKFPGFLSYFRELERVRRSFGEYCRFTIDEEATEKLREQYRQFVKDIDEIKSDLEDNRNHIRQLEAQIEHYKKMARLAKEIVSPGTEEPVKKVK